MRAKIGREGSTDRVILRTGIPGLRFYLAVKFFGRHRRLVIH